MNAKWILVLLFLFPCLMSSVCSAGCTAQNGWNNVRFSYNFPATIIVQRDMPVGSTIGEYSVSNPVPGQQALGCTAGIYTVDARYDKAWTNSGDIVQTNVPGVGMRIYWMASGSTPMLIKDGLANLNYAIGFSFAWKTGEPAWKIQLIKTGPITAGVLETGGYATFIIGNVPLTGFNITGGGRIIPVACSITSQSIQVPLADVLGSDLTSIGTVAKPKNFSLGLNCDAGARVNVTLVGEQHSDTSAPGVLQLSNPLSSDTALGVGIQILYNNAPLPLNTNIMLRTSVGGVETFPFTAQYYQTRGTVRTGTANATATLNLTYQ